MTAEEAIRLLHPDTTADAIRDIRYDCSSNGGRDAAIAAVEEACIIACRALETIAELEKRGITVDTINKYKAFEDECISKGFTFESLLEAREKQTAKKPTSKHNFAGLRIGFCPSCIKNAINSGMDCCDKCGQAIDWSEE